MCSKSLKYKSYKERFSLGILCSHINFTSQKKSKCHILVYFLQYIPVTLLMFNHIYFFKPHKIFILNEIKSTLLSSVASSRKETYVSITQLHVSIIRIITLYDLFDLQSTMGKSQLPKFALRTQKFARISLLEIWQNDDFTLYNFFVFLKIIL